MSSEVPVQETQALMDFEFAGTGVGAEVTGAEVTGVEVTGVVVLVGVPVGAAADAAPVEPAAVEPAAGVPAAVDPAALEEAAVVFAPTTVDAVAAALPVTAATAPAMVGVEALTEAAVALVEVAGAGAGDVEVVPDVIERVISPDVPPLEADDPPRLILPTTAVMPGDEAAGLALVELESPPHPASAKASPRPPARDRTTNTGAGRVGRGALRDD